MFRVSFAPTEQTFDAAPVPAAPFCAEMTPNVIGQVLGGLTPDRLGHALAFDDAGRLAVQVAEGAEQDNTLPITSAAVHTTVGNIEILLSTI